MTRNHLEQLQDVVSDVVVHKGGIQDLEVCIVNMLKNKAWCLRLLVANNIQQLDNVGTSAKILKNFDLSLDLHTKGN